MKTIASKRGRRKLDPNLIPESPDLKYELAIWKNGSIYIAGIDEAGRGALAGPVFAAAVILPNTTANLPELLHGVLDSKEMTHKQRVEWSARIPSIALHFGVGSASHAEVDRSGIISATYLAIRRALLELNPFPDHLLIDALYLKNFPVPQTSLIKGDARSLSIAAASIMAKVNRDKKMVELDTQYPGYGFAKHKGYGTSAHFNAIKKLGPCPIHRKSFSPFRKKLL